jgi:hypothetical protein
MSGTDSIVTALWPSTADLLVVEVPRSLPANDKPFPKPPVLLYFAKKVLVDITYHNPTADITDRKLLSMQLTYLMQTAKLLASNGSLRELELQFSDPSFDLLHHWTCTELAWPFLLFLRGVPKINITRRRFVPDGTWHKPTDHNALPYNVKELLLFKCSNGGGASLDPRCRKEMTSYEEKLAKDFDEEVTRGWSAEEVKEALEVKKQFSANGGRLAPRGEFIGRWPGWNTFVLAG